LIIVSKMFNKFQMLFRNPAKKEAPKRVIKIKDFRGFKEFLKEFKPAQRSLPQLDAVKLAALKFDKLPEREKAKYSKKGQLRKKQKQAKLNRKKTEPMICQRCAMFDNMESIDPPIVSKANTKTEVRGHNETCLDNERLYADDTVQKCPNNCSDDCDCTDRYIEALDKTFSNTCFDEHHEFCDCLADEDDDDLDLRYSEFCFLGNNRSSRVAKKTNTKKNVRLNKSLNYHAYGHSYDKGLDDGNRSTAEFKSYYKLFRKRHPEFSYCAGLAKAKYHYERKTESLHLPFC